jgi:hypothetical protein
VLRLREGADFDERLGAEARERGAERDGADSRTLERLRLGADCRLGAESRLMTEPREGAEARLPLERDGADERSRLEPERVLRPRGMATDERSLRLDRELRSALDLGDEETPERELRSGIERKDERSSDRVEALSLPRERLVIDSREAERDGVLRDDDPLRSDSLRRLARLDEVERVLSDARLRDSARAGARPLTVRSRCDWIVARSALRVAERLSLRLRAAARDSRRLLPWRDSAIRSERDCEREAAAVRDRVSRSKLDRARCSAAHSRRASRLSVALRPCATARLLSTKRVCSTRPR